MIKDTIKISKFVGACCDGNLTVVKEYYNKHGNAITSFKSKNQGGIHQFPIFYAIKNSKFEVALYLKSINPEHASTILTVNDIYKLVVHNRKNEYNELINLLINDFGYTRTKILEIAVSCFSRISSASRISNLFAVLVEEFDVDFNEIEKQFINRTSPASKQILREIRLIKLLS